MTAPFRDVAFLESGGSVIPVLVGDDQYGERLASPLLLPFLDAPTEYSRPAAACDFVDDAWRYGLPMTSGADPVAVFEQELESVGGVLAVALGFGNPEGMDGADELSLRASLSTPEAPWWFSTRLTVHRYTAFVSVYDQRQGGKLIVKLDVGHQVARVVRTVRALGHTEVPPGIRFVADETFRAQDMLIHAGSGGVTDLSVARLKMLRKGVDWIENEENPWTS